MCSASKLAMAGSKNAPAMYKRMTQVAAARAGVQQVRADQGRRRRAAAHQDLPRPRHGHAQGRRPGLLPQGALGAHCLIDCHGCLGVAAVSADDTCNLLQH